MPGRSQTSSSGVATRSTSQLAWSTSTSVAARFRSGAGRRSCWRDTRHFHRSIRGGENGGGEEPLVLRRRRFHCRRIHAHLEALLILVLEFYVPVDGRE